MNSTYSKHDARHKVLECLSWSFNVLGNLAANAGARSQFVFAEFIKIARKHFGSSSLFVIVVYLFDKK